MASRSRLLSWLALSLALAAALPDVRWCRMAWADVPAECWADAAIACRATACDDDSSCETACTPNASPSSACDPGACDAPPSARAWCPSDALGGPAVPGAGPDLDPPSASAPCVPVLEAAPAAANESLADDHPPPASRDPGGGFFIRGPPSPPIRLV